MLDCITSLQNGADLLWIETEKPHIEQIAGMVDRIREVIPNAKLAYNNSPVVQLDAELPPAGLSTPGRRPARTSRTTTAPTLMSVDYDGTALAAEADERIRTFQADARQARRHLPPPDHAADLSHGGAVDRQPGRRNTSATRACSATSRSVQREEIRQGIACVKHQNMSGSDIGDDHKEYFAGEAALKAGGAHNTMNQFG